MLSIYVCATHVCVCASGRCQPALSLSLGCYCSFRSTSATIARNSAYDTNRNSTSTMVSCGLLGATPAAASTPATVVTPAAVAPALAPVLAPPAAATLPAVAATGAATPAPARAAATGTTAGPEAGPAPVAAAAAALAGAGAVEGARTPSPAAPAAPVVDVAAAVAAVTDAVVTSAVLDEGDVDDDDAVVDDDDVVGWGTACMCIFEISLAYLLGPAATAAPAAGSGGSRAAMGPQLGQHHDWDSRAKRRRSPGDMSSAPTAPSPLVGMKLMSASRIRRTATTDREQ